MLSSAELKRSLADLEEKAKNFLDAKEDEKGTMSAADAATFAKMEKEIENLKAQAQLASFKEEKEMEHQIANSEPINSNSSYDGRPYIASRSYKENFFKALRKNFKAGNTVKLVEGTSTQGGYLVPTEFSEKIQSALEEENAIRQIGTLITTESEYLIPFVATKPTANWVSEGQTVDLTSETFGRISLGAHKLACATTVSNELLADSFYDLQAHLTLEFSKATARAEEEAFLTGDGNGQPTGILTTIAADADRWKETSKAASISADDLINLQYSVRRPYRKNACWLINDETLIQIRKLKDSTQNFIWQPSLLENEPPRLFGQPVYTSPFMPPPESGKIAVLYGDFSYYVIAERGQRTIKALKELFALQDISAFLLLERIDGILTDTEAIRGLKIK